MSDAIKVKSGPFWYVPDVECCVHISNGLTFGPYWRTVRDLMLAGFCLLFFLGCASTPKFEVEAITPAVFEVSVNAMQSKQDDTLAAIKENTAAIEKIVVKVNSLEGAILETRQAVGTTQLQLEAAQVSSQSEPGKEVIKSVADTSPDNTAHDSQIAQGSGAESGDVPLFVSVTRFCQPCNMVKRDFLKGKLKGFAVTFCTQTEQHRDELIAEGIPAENVIVQDIPVAKGYPAIRYPSSESVTGWRWHNTPSYGPRVLMELRATLLGEKTPVEYPQTFVEPIQSHGDLVSLHNTLHGGGQWTWPGDLATHLSQSHGVNLNGTAANYSGNQITSQRTALRSVSRGPVINWRARSVSRSTCPTCPR